MTRLNQLARGTDIHESQQRMFFRVSAKLFSLILLFTLTPLTNLRSQWVQTNGPTGGYVRGFGTAGGRLFVGTQGGVFRSTDRGTSWAASSSGLDLWVYACAGFGDTVLAGSWYGGGMYRSTNGGITWAYSSAGLPNITWVSAIVTVGTDVFVSTGSGVYRSTDSGQSWIAANNGITNLGLRCLIAKSTFLFAGGDGLYRSSDSGANWEQVTNGLTNTVVNALATDGVNLFAGTTGGVFLSTSNGDSWDIVNGGLSFTLALAVFPDGLGGTNLFAGRSYGGGISRSSDNGANWTPVNTGLGNSWVNSLFVMDTLLFAGTDGGVYVSTNQGNNWIAANNGLLNSNIWALLTTGTNLFAGTIGTGLVRSTNNGATWNRSNAGVADSSVWCLARRETTLFAGTQERGVFRSTDNGQNWLEANTGLTSWSLTAFAIKETVVYAGTRLGGVFRSTDDGSSWSEINNGLGVLAVRGLTVNGNDLIAATNNGVFFSTNGGNNWQERSSGLTNTNIATVLVENSSLFAASGHGVFMSTDNGLSWVPRNNGITFGIPIVTLISGGRNIFAGSYYGMFKTSNAGTNWAAISEGLINKRILSFSGRGRYLYAGTEGMGVWRREATISGTVFDDMNGNGIREAGDTALANWRVLLHDAFNNILDSSLTDAFGEYGFFEVPPGQYFVSEVVQEDWVQTSPRGTGTHSVTVTTGNFYNGLDFGNKPGFRYIGPTGGKWSQGVNWLGNHPPTPTDAVLVPVNKIIDVDALPSDSIQYTRVLPTGGLAFSNNVGSLKVKGSTRIENGATISFPSTNDSTGIICYSDFINKGTLTPGRSTFRFQGNRRKLLVSNESETQQTNPFHNLSILGDSTQALGNTRVDSILKLTYSITQRTTDTLSILYAEPAAIEGSGRVPQGSLSRRIKPNTSTRYRFESDSTYIQFSGGPYPLSVTVSTYPDSLPPIANWLPFNGTVRVDTINNIVHATTSQPYRKWAIGIPRTGLQPNAPPQFVRRLYILSATGDTTAPVELSLRYEQKEVQPGMDESSMTLFAIDAPPGAAQIRASVKVYLEGAFDSLGGTMTNSLRTNGTLAAHFPAGMPIPVRSVDSITIEIRGATNSQSTLSSGTTSANRKVSQPAWLLTDGTIRSYYDTLKNYVEFDTTAGSYYLVVRHRNHIAIASALPQPLSSDTATVYNFTANQAQAWGQIPMKQMGNHYCMIAGEVNGSDIITAADANQVFGSIGQAGYRLEDINLNGIVTSADANVTLCNLNRALQVPSALPTNAQSPKHTTVELGNPASVLSRKAEEK